MSQFLIFAATTTEEVGTIGKITQTFGWHPQLFFSQVILFIIVASVLSKFAYKPLLAMLEQRRARIEETVANSERIKDELAKAEETRKEIISKANEQANGLIEEARAAAAKVQETESQKAIAAAEDIIAKARKAAEADHAKMVADLKREIGQLVVKTTAQVAGKVLSDKDQKTLVEEANKQIAA